jgi:hypothetical protein
VGSNSLSPHEQETKLMRHVKMSGMEYNQDERFNLSLSLSFHACPPALLYPAFPSQLNHDLPGVRCLIFLTNPILTFSHTVHCLYAPLAQASSNTLRPRTTAQHIASRIASALTYGFQHILSVEFWNPFSVWYGKDLRRRPFLFGLS